MSLEAQFLQPDDPSVVASSAAGRDYDDAYPGGEKSIADENATSACHKEDAMHVMRHLALLVVVVLSIAFFAPPATSALPTQWCGATSCQCEVSTDDWKGDSSTTGDDDRWGEPGSSDPSEDVGTEEDGGEDDEPGNGKAFEPGHMMFRLLLGNWFVL